MIRAVSFSIFVFGLSASSVLRADGACIPLHCPASGFLEDYSAEEGLNVLSGIHRTGVFAMNDPERRLDMGYEVDLVIDQSSRINDIAHLQIGLFRNVPIIGPRSNDRLQFSAP